MTECGYMSQQARAAIIAGLDHGLTPFDVARIMVGETLRFALHCGAKTSDGFWDDFDLDEEDAPSEELRVVHFGTCDARNPQHCDYVLWFHKELGYSAETACKTARPPITTDWFKSTAAAVAAYEAAACT
jgi:hypothetical protein